jgi:hypothetical protein
MKSQILKENLAIALRMAIAEQETHEKHFGYICPSAFLAGLRENLKALYEGELEIKY